MTEEQREIYEYTAKKLGLCPTPKLPLAVAVKKAIKEMNGN